MGRRLSAIDFLSHDSYCKNPQLPNWTEDSQSQPDNSLLY